MSTTRFFHSVFSRVFISALLLLSSVSHAAKKKCEVAVKPQLVVVPAELVADTSKIKPRVVWETLNTLVDTQLNQRKSKLRQGSYFADSSFNFRDGNSLSGAALLEEYCAERGLYKLVFPAPAEQGQCRAAVISAYIKSESLDDFKENTTADKLFKYVRYGNTAKRYSIPESLIGANQTLKAEDLHAVFDYVVDSYFNGSKNQFKKHGGRFLDTSFDIEVLNPPLHGWEIVSLYLKGIGIKFSTFGAGTYDEAKILNDIILAYTLSKNFDEFDFRLRVATTLAPN